METTNNNTRTLEQVQQEKRSLIDKLDFRTNFKEYKEKISLLEEEERKLKVQKLIEERNRHFAKIREKALQVWKVGEILEDITTSDGSPHKSKAKKYPALELIEYARLKFENGRITSINDFRLYSEKYEYNKPTQYTRPASFEDFLELNNIPIKPFTAKGYEATKKKLDKANAKLEEAIQEYKNTREELKIYSLQNWGFVDQQNMHEYKYTFKH